MVVCEAESLFFDPGPVFDPAVVFDIDLVFDLDLLFDLEQPKQHLDSFSLFAVLTVVTNRQ